MLTTIIVFIVILGILVFVHEFGHFWVAKKSGMKVDEFGFGFPPRMVGIQKANGKWKFVWGHKEPMDKNQTVYSINWIPFGGFVKILGENNEDADHPGSFINKGFWPRFLTLVAGVSMNWLLAFVLFSLTFAIGITAEIVPGDPLFNNAKISDRQVAISLVVPDMPAAKAGIKEGDIVLSVDGKNFTAVSELQDYIKANKGKVFGFEIQRLDEKKNIEVQSTANPKEGEGPTGIAITSIGKVKLPWYTAIKTGVSKTWGMTAAIFDGLWKTFFRPFVYPFYSLVRYGHWAAFQAPDVSQVGGPIKIAQITGQIARLGLVPILNFMGLLSINLAVLNILPIPALDGGRVLFLIIEKIRRKRNSQRLEQIVNTAGFLVLIMLMVLVTIKDIISK